MKLYHFTAYEYMQSIADQGLTKGEVPLSPTVCENAVWLTSDENPTGHGLSEGGELTGKILKTAIAVGMVKEGERAFFPNKRAVRLEVEVDDDDLALVHWPEYAVRRGVKRQWRRTLNKTGGGKAKTWWLYLGQIPPDQIAAFDVMTGQSLKLD